MELFRDVVLSNVLFYFSNILQRSQIYIFFIRAMVVLIELYSFDVNKCQTSLVLRNIFLMRIVFIKSSLDKFFYPLFSLCFLLIILHTIKDSWFKTFFNDILLSDSTNIYLNNLFTFSFFVLGVEYSHFSINLYSSLML